MSDSRSNSILEDRVLQAGEEWSRVLAPGQILRIIDLEGYQAVDFLCYNAKDPAERYNAADTMKINGSIFIRKGAKIYSDMGNPSSPSSRIAAAGTTPSAAAARTRRTACVTAPRTGRTAATTSSAH